MLVVIIIFAVLLLDQITKYLVVIKMTQGMSIPVLEDVFHLTYILNPGAAFGMLEHNRFFFIATACLAIMAIMYMWSDIKKESKMIQIGVALFTGGALGNLIDRIQTGLVIDFFDFRIWPIFNVADIGICVGVGLILWSMIKMELQMKK